MSGQGERQSSVGHITPLRYPGGKGKLAEYIKQVLRVNELFDGEYVEPYAGGAAVALELLLCEYVSVIRINDVSRPIYAFWKSVLDNTDALSRLVVDTPLTVRSWDKQKLIMRNARDYDNLSLGFATFFLNRTNRSGILNGGIIGGRDQEGPWKIDARYNRRELVRRIEAIAAVKKRIKVTRLDALRFIRDGVGKWPDRTLLYLDPPYFVKGRDLYYDFYEPDDHKAVATFVTKDVIRQKWIVSYDNAPQIRSLYRGQAHIVYDIGYSARSASVGTEIMFFGPRVKIPPVVGPIRLVASRTEARWSA